jgi:hypothetical protein
MRSRVLRITLAAILLAAAAAAAALLVRSEQTLATARATLSEFDQHARETAEHLFDARAAQQAYVAAGQGLDYWVPRTATAIDQAKAALQTLLQQARSEEAAATLQSAAAAVDDLSEIDGRARAYLHSDQTLMASDVIFTEGGSTAAAAGRQIDGARASERAAFDAREFATRRLEAAALAGFGVFAIFTTVLLALTGRSAPASEMSVADAGPSVDAELPLHVPTSSLAAPRVDESLASLRAAAEVCSAFGQVTDLEGVQTLLGSVATSLGASGVIVWLGSADGADLRPALAHGYPPQALSRMTAISRTADNAAAAAYRTGHFQVVRVGQHAPGAVVAPLLVPGGCIGALTAEVRAGNEASETVRALSTVYAAQLAGILATPAAAEEPTVSRTAAG